MGSLVSPALTLPAPLAIGITPRTSHVLSLLFTTSYVGSIYLSQLFSNASRRYVEAPPSTVTGIPPISATDSNAQSSVEPGPALGSRDHPETIKRRMKAVGAATLLSIGGVWYVVKETGRYSGSEAVIPTLELLGIPTCIAAVKGTGVLPYLLAPILLSGPLFAEYLDGDLLLQRYNQESLWEGVKSAWKNFGLVEARNFIVGPLTEELVFRSTILAVSILGGLNTRSLIFGTPLWFGLAHAHHAYEVWSKGGKTRQAAVQALAGCVFQLGYTTLFGWFASFLFVKTGSVLPPLISHVFCNVMGIYLPTTAVARHPKRKIAIWTAYLAGIVGFVFGIRAM